MEVEKMLNRIARRILRWEIECYEARISNLWETIHYLRTLRSCEYEEYQKEKSKMNKRLTELKRENKSLKRRIKDLEK